MKISYTIWLNQVIRDSRLRTNIKYINFIFFDTFNYCNYQATHDTFSVFEKFREYVNDKQEPDSSPKKEKNAPIGREIFTGFEDFKSNWTLYVHTFNHLLI